MGVGSTQALHVPVMWKEVVSYLVKPKYKVFLDCTVGLGGHSLKILEASPPDVYLVGIDVDPQALAIAEETLYPYKERTCLVRGNFADLDRVIANAGISRVDGVLMDLGVSSMQIDEPGRGFSFIKDGPLDMRMDQTLGTPISDDINRLSVQELEKIIRNFGEERFARRISLSIAKAREKAPILTTLQLANIITNSKPRSDEKIHPATRTFQALRIYKNQELKNLELGLEKAISILNPGGRICVISFHSLEDRIVKSTFRSLAQGCICPPKTPKCICNQRPQLKIITKRPVKPSKEEIIQNPRSRSAKLRVAEKL